MRCLWKPQCHGDKNNGPERSLRATALEWVDPRLTDSGEVHGQHSQHLAKNPLSSCKDGGAHMSVRPAIGVCLLNSVVPEETP